MTRITIYDDDARKIGGLSVIEDTTIAEIIHRILSDHWDDILESAMTTESKLTEVEDWKWKD